MLLGDAEARAQFRLEKRADAGLEQDCLSGQILDQQTTTGQRNGIVLVSGDPFLPDRLWRIAKHRATIETLRISK